MKLSRISAVAVVLLAATAVWADEDKKLVTVFPFHAAGVSETEAATLTGLFETGLVNTMLVRVVEHTERAKLLEAVEETISDCVDEKCAVEIGKQLAADSVFLGEVSRLGESYLVNVKLIDIARGENIGANSMSASSLGALASEMKDLAWLMVAGQQTAGGGVMEVEGEVEEEEKTSSASQGTQKTYVTFRSSPPGVAFKLYDVGGTLLFEDMTPKALRVTLGSYRIEASRPLHYDFRDVLRVSSTQKSTYTIVMKPNFGGVSITSTPSGADVLLDGLKVGTTPFSREELKSKNYDFVVTKDLYAPAGVSVEVRDGETSPASVRLVAEFIELSVSEEAGLAGRVYVDGDYKGRLPLTGKLSYRPFALRVAPEDTRYHEYTERVNPRTRGETVERRISLEGKYAVVAVDTEPFIEGEVFIDGERVGTSPDQFRVLQGEHEVRVEGMHDGKKVAATRTVTVEEHDDVELTLAVKPVGSDVTVRTVPAGSWVYLDGKYQGMSPETVKEVKPGRHTVKVEKPGYDTAEKTITVREGENSTLTVVLEKEIVVPEMVLVEGGSFEMGSTSGGSDEKSVYTVRVSSFYMAEYEVTQGEWKAVMGRNPSNCKGDTLPVEQVSWYDAVEYCNALSEREGLTKAYTIRGETVSWNSSAEGYRLPTEAEWEYAARGGSKSRGYSYSGSNTAGDVGWYDDNSGSKTQPVGGKRANELGLYDMSGNVWEWCWDWYGSYSWSSQTDPRGPSTGTCRVLRGGSWYGNATYLRAAFRNDFTPDHLFGLGFRVVRAAPR